MERKKIIKMNRKFETFLKYFFVAGIYVFVVSQLSYFTLTDVQELGILFATIVLLRQVIKS